MRELCMFHGSTDPLTGPLFHTSSRKELGLELSRGGAGILRQLRFTPQTPDGNSAGCGCSTRKGHKR